MQQHTDVHTALVAVTATLAESLRLQSSASHLLAQVVAALAGEGQLNTAASSKPSSKAEKTVIALEQPATPKPASKPASKPAQEVVVESKPAAKPASKATAGKSTPKSTPKASEPAPKAAASSEKKPFTAYQLENGDLIAGVLLKDGQHKDDVLPYAIRQQVHERMTSKHAAQYVHLEGDKSVKFFSVPKAQVRSGYAVMRIGRPQDATQAKAMAVTALGALVGDNKVA